MVRLGPEAILKDEQTGDPDSIISLSLTHKALSDVSCLGDFKNLERLDLSFNNLTSLQGLESCLKLKWLSVAMNKLQSLKGVEGLNKLTVLNAGKNMLRSMDGVQNLANLRALILNDNEISSICKLDQMKDLNTLVLSRNPVGKIHGSLAKLKSISKISLSNCELAAIDSSIKDCAELKELRLAHNDIKALPAELAHARKLQNLDLGNNLITHWSDLKVLSSLHSLKNLNLLGNPIAEKDKLMKKIKKLVPSLRIFNVKPIDKFTKNEKGNLVEDPSISAAHDLGIENRGKKKSGHGDFNRVTKEGISRNSKGLDKDKHSSQKEFEVSDKLTEERVFGQNVSALKSKLKKNSKVEESDAILTDEKELKQEQRGDHPKKKKTPKESVMSRSRDDDLDNARDDGQKGKKKRKKKTQAAEVLAHDATWTTTDKKLKRKREQADVDIMDDKETPFAELFAADAADNLKFRGEERGDKAVQDADAISGLVTFPSKRKKIKIHGIGSSVLQFMSPAAEVGLGGPSAWGDDE